MEAPATTLGTLATSSIVGARLMVWLNGGPIPIPNSPIALKPMPPSVSTSVRSLAIAIDAPDAITGSPAMSPIDVAGMIMLAL